VDAQNRLQGTAGLGPDPAANLAKARSLGSALLAFTALPWALCAVFFSGLHWTYPADRDRAQGARAGAGAGGEAGEQQPLTEPAAVELTSRV
jgi:hypothetical protein